MLTKEEKQEIFKDIIWEVYPKRPYGGQNINYTRNGVKLIHLDFDFEIACAEFRSQHECREFCLTIFDLFLDEKIKK